MPAKQTAAEIFEQEFLDIRHRFIDIASALDRIERGKDAAVIESDPRLAQLHQAAGILTDNQPSRAERVQMVFSDMYRRGWRV